MNGGSAAVYRHDSIFREITARYWEDKYAVRQNEKALNPIVGWGLSSFSGFHVKSTVHSR
jgi:hypothetical protein